MVFRGQDIRPALHQVRRQPRRQVRQHPDILQGLRQFQPFGHRRAEQEHKHVLVLRRERFILRRGDARFFHNGFGLIHRKLGGKSHLEHADDEFV